MQTAMRQIASRGVAAIACVVLTMGLAWSADPAPAAPSAQVPSKEMREKMATMHEKMAACLRSDKSVADCRAETMKSCKGAMSTDDCLMMGMGAAKGMRHGRMTQAPPAK